MVCMVELCLTSVILACNKNNNNVCLVGNGITRMQSHFGNWRRRTHIGGKQRRAKKRKFFLSSWSTKCKCPIDICVCVFLLLPIGFDLLLHFPNDGFSTYVWLLSTLTVLIVSHRCLPTECLPTYMQSCSLPICDLPYIRFSVRYRSKLTNQT